MIERDLVQCCAERYIDKQRNMFDATHGSRKREATLVFWRLCQLPAHSGTHDRHRKSGKPTAPKTSYWCPTLLIWRLSARFTLEAAMHCEMLTLHCRARRVPVYSSGVNEYGVVEVRLGLLVILPAPDRICRTSIDTAATVCRSVWLSMLGHDSCRANFVLREAVDRQLQPPAPCSPYREHKLSHKKTFGGYYASQAVGLCAAAYLPLHACSTTFPGRPEATC